MSLEKHTHMYLEVKKSCEVSNCPTKSDRMEKEQITALFKLNKKLRLLKR